MSLLAAGAEQTPILAIVDDAHRLDAPSREALLFAGRRVATERVVVLMAMRERSWLVETDRECFSATSQRPRNPAGRRAWTLSRFALIESVNTKIRLLTRIAFGVRPPDALIALAMLSFASHRASLPGDRASPPGRAA